MTAKTLLFHGEARAKMLAGMNVLANAVRGALGPRARTVVLERSYGAPTVINSGVLVAKEVELEDPCENMGAQLAREAYGDMVGMGILDPCKVTRAGLQNAASIAGLVLTTDCMIARAPAKNGAAGAGGMDD